MMRIVFSFLWTCLLLGSVQAQIKSADLLTKTPCQYCKTEWRIVLNAQWDNPYLQEDVALDMHLTSPSGKQLVLPCFYEHGASGSDSYWKAHFMPQEKGNYSYQLVLKEKGSQKGTLPGGVFKVSSSGNNGILHQKNNWVFEFDNGKPFRGIGENIGWESRAHDDSKFFKALHEQPKYNYEYMLPRLAASGGNFFRTWVCSFNLPVDWKSGFNSIRYTPTTDYLNPSAIAKMDRLVQLCDSLGLYMMLTLGQGAYHTRDGGFASSSADFFVNTKAKQQYKNRLRYFVARWGYSSSIAAWEFFNEVDNVQFANREHPIDAASIVQWHNEMSTCLKQLDPYGHLVTTSISHRDLAGLNALAFIDFNQKHIYRNTKGMAAEIVKYEEAYNKPYVIGEFSYEWDWSKDFNLFAAEMDSDFKRGLWYGLFSPTPVLPLSWWWEYFENRNTDQYIQHVRTILDRMLQKGNGSFQPAKATASAPGAELFSVSCGKETYIYLYNPSASPLSTDISLNIPKAGKYLLETYWCETGKFDQPKKITAMGNLLNIPGLEFPPQTDIVLVIK